MRTLIVSDLHVGTHTATDVLRRPAGLAALLGALDGVDRLILLGDAIELRSAPVRQALAAARPFLAPLGRALDGREVVLVPGNHDHAFVAPWLALREEPLTSEQRIPAHAASVAAEMLAACLGPGARLELAYPGIWIRDDVYATHGHYLDAHMTVPTFERIAIGAMGRFVGLPANAACRPEDYEAIVAPVYAWIHAVAQTQGRAGAVNGGGSARLWRAMAASGARPRLRTRALGAAIPAAIAALNRAGLGPLSSDFSGEELRRGRLRAIGCVLEQLAIDARHVIFGHTHRTGPLAGDDPSEWITPAGTRLYNCGSWVFETHLMTEVVGASPYWPGGCLTVEDTGPPLLRRLLGASPASAFGVG